MLPIVINIWETTINMTRGSTVREHFDLYTNESTKRRAVCKYCEYDGDDNATGLRAHIFGGKTVAIYQGKSAVLNWGTLS